MSVRDDGPGADPAAVKASKGLGIRTVERRLRLGDGERARFSIATAPGAGFEVALSVPGEIEYLKADSKYTAIVRKGQTYLVRIGISELEARLDPARFVRIHRSALVNLDFVESMKADEQSLLQLEMRDGAVLTANREASRMLREMAI
jgi:DNA-binding LytR/AlgR family response regulator